MKLSMDGKTKSFDSNPAGCSKSESINVLFLQKAKDALRVYAEVVYIKSEFTQLEEDENCPKYGFYRNSTISADFIKKFYQEADVSPDVVEYVEAVGSAVTEADKSELQSIDEVFCKNRSDPLKVGSVMSNIGYTEAASGICAITKVSLYLIWGVFRSIYNASLSLSEANIKWEDNWVAMLDIIMVRNYKKKKENSVNEDDAERAVLCVVNNGMKLKTAAAIYNIKPTTLYNRVKIFKENITLKIKEYSSKHTVYQVFTNDEEYMLEKCGGIIMQNIRFHDLPTVCKNVGLKTLKFIPHFSTNAIDKS
ncbi:unnamed protein product, partial [Brenthis ino]